MRRRLLEGLWGFLCFAVIGTGTLLAQGASGTITGVVTDPTGAVVPGAAVTILNERTGVDFHLTTNSAGIYRAPSLIPGIYTVKVEARGFRTYVNQRLGLTTGQTLGVDVALELGAETQTITVEAAAPLVNTEEGRLSTLVNATQVRDMPLNGRNIYQLMQLIPGAVNSTAVNLEQNTGGFQTNVNGTRANFNGFLLDGVSNKGLSGGSNSQPAPDFVQEFRIMTNNYSAQYGNSAGSITDASIKSGTNELHGDAWEYLRHDKLNARNFFDGDQKSHWRQNQFGFDLGGPIKKDRLFFFAGYEGQRFRTEVPAQYTIETPVWRQAVQSAVPNSVAALLYRDFPSPDPTEGLLSVDDVISGQAVDYYGVGVGDYYGEDAAENPAGLISSPYLAYTDPCFLAYWNGVGAPAFGGGPAWGDPQATAEKFASLLGVTAGEQAQIQANINTVDGCAGLAAPAARAGAIGRAASMLGLVNAKYSTRTVNQFYNGDQVIGRVDYQGENTRIFGRFYYDIKKDPNITALNSAIRGFNVPYEASFPSATLSIVHTFSPTVVNEFRFGYMRNNSSWEPDPSQFGVPQIGYDTGEVLFGAYNGYPQFFTENVYNFADMVSVVKGKHSLSVGAEVKRNLENSEFNVGRPSYYFFDILYFAADLPYWQAVGVNPELAAGGSAHIDTNIRAWRNTELGFFFQDDWKVSKNLTLNFGLRWDYFSPHTEKDGLITNFIIPAEGLASINCQASIGGECVAPLGVTNVPNGGFVIADQLTAPDRNNWSPRFGFSWDPTGSGKTAIRGGFAIFYESTLYNPLSNSRWNLPFYSFNLACPLCGLPGLPTYAPTNPDGTANTGAAPSYSGPADNPGQGPEDLGFAGNIMGWFPTNPNLAYLTGIPDPSGMRTPYVENAFLGFQRELTPTTVVEVNWVGTFGKKLFWAENPNRVVNGRARESVIDPCTGADVAPTPLVNPCFGTLRTWKNSVNSSYNALQAQLIRKMSRGFAWTSAYTWSHTIDYRSSWHGLTGGGSATEANTGYGASGYAMDADNLSLERGSSLFDIRHRWVNSIVWELPWLKSQQGVVGKIFGGWQTNYILSFQSGFPFTVGARRDYNGDGIMNDRPDTPVWGNSFPFENHDFVLGSGPDGQSLLQSLESFFPTPEPGTNGNLGRNTFRGPGFAQLDFSLFKTIPFNEQYRLQFRAEFFNLTNRVNFFQPIGNLVDRNFGLSQQAFDPRVIQFGLRLSF